MTSHLRIKTAPALEPVSLVDLKLFLRIDHNEEDYFLENTLLKSARQMAEDFTGRAFVTQTWTLWLDCLPGMKSSQWWDGVRDGHYRTILGGGDEVVIPRPPLISVTHFKSYNDDDTADTFDLNGLIVDTTSQPGRIILKNGYVWPTNLRAGKAIEIEFIAGYGSPSAVPQQIKHAILTICAQMYENRGESAVMSSLSQSLLAPYREYRL